MQCGFRPLAKWGIKSKHWGCGYWPLTIFMNKEINQSINLSFFSNNNSRCSLLIKCNSHLKLKPELICTSVRLAWLQRPAQTCSLAHIYIRIYHPWIAPLLHQRGFDFSMQGLPCVISPGCPVVCCSSASIFSAAKPYKIQEMYVSNS